MKHLLKHHMMHFLKNPLKHFLKHFLTESQDHYKMISRVYVNGELYKKVNPMVDTCVVLDLQVY